MPLISLDIRMLRSFVSVVQTGSITVTARQLGRTQPAITLQLQRLEELINTPLLRHGGRRQLLTDDGDPQPFPVPRERWWKRPTFRQPLDAALLSR